MRNELFSFDCADKKCFRATHPFRPLFNVARTFKIFWLHVVNCVSCKSYNIKMPKRKLEMKLDSDEEKLLLPSSSEDELESGSDVSDEDGEDVNDEDGKIKDPFLNEDSDSDSSPETLSFKSALEDSKKLRLHRTQVIKTDIDEKKRKRKEIHSQVMKQKEEKKLKIDEKKLPDDILENLEDIPQFVDNGKESDYEDEETPIDSVPEDVIATHGPTIFKCKVLPVEAMKCKFVSQDIARFKENKLYRGHIRREKSSRAAMLKTQKQLVN
ncbi:uncharacterized protein NPIL_576651 [Nephila pilipes]|uniref:Uncharacterized protein n=1 Tax=Nephila pilipes TaxID=299642 RepID=A0A8X6MX78_NEPPI|nr:uncharacterized protein NPIL_576651 [Nephila pilipes]